MDVTLCSLGSGPSPKSGEERHAGATGGRPGPMVVSARLLSWGSVASAGKEGIKDEPRSRSACVIIMIAAGSL
ncbi:hypothetical protein MA04_00599 [Alcanivorax balearicus MACL04]|uniref:ESPR domain-containing protein n=1 Tax=Alloalcanivorax balearicus MACL04 TaxID=1177182 RepID=A0ABT2QUU2_9GAMM|nr:hypothetical protein [Alloalcanivorax balearicus MACL04]